MRVLKPLPVDMVRRSFFNTSVADIYRAVDGQSMLGAFTQLLCSLDAMSQLCESDKDTQATSTVESCTSCHRPKASIETCRECGQALPDTALGRTFRRWIRDWLRKHSDYKPDEQFLYELRCGLVHAHGGGPAFSLTHGHPEQHWNGLVRLAHQQKGYILNLDSILAEYTLAVSSCFDDLEPHWSEDPRRTVRQLDRLISLVTYGEYIEPPKKFAQMHRHLAFLDQRAQQTASQLQQKIQRSLSAKEKS